jgi:hypothetical protein
MKPLHLAAVLVPGALAACAAAAPAPPVPSHAGGLAEPIDAASSSPAASLAGDASIPDEGAVSSSYSDAAADAAEPIATEPGAAAPSTASACNEQPPQDFLVRGNFLKTGPSGNARAIQYRTETYGYFKGFGRPGADARPPSAFVVDTTFMGLPIKMHRKVVPALKCVEEEIRRSCADHPYTPHALAGIRTHNTYRGGEVTNHIFGIAIDIDPAINTCCGCVKPWNDAPACRRPAKTEYDRMAMPECWVHAFERYGFYWLGHDVLRDTMHFEFLGDPDRILKTPLPVAGGT